MVLLPMACTQKPAPGKVRAEISLKSITAGSNNFDGGALLRLVGGGETHNFELTQSNVIELPKGTWTIYFVGFAGPSNFTGGTDCRKLPNVVLSEDSHTINFAAGSNCINDTVASNMITTKNPDGLKGTWGSSKWNDTLWAP